MTNKKKFKMPSKSNLKGRTSTINNAFAIGITPYLKPDADVLDSYYSELKIEPDQCGYCLRIGEGKTMDHINPLVVAGMPSGYITDINNLIPCCKDCNSKKGGKFFSKWYKESDNVSRLLSMGMSMDDIEERYNIIMKYIKDHCTNPYDYKKIVGDDKWNEYISRKKQMIKLLEEDQKFCDDLNVLITKEVIKISKK